MSDAILFDRHYKAGFRDIWSSDIPKFTPVDWRELIVLGLKIDWLTHFYDMQADFFEIQKEFQTVHSSIAPEFWNNIGANPKQSSSNLSPELLKANINVGVLLGLSLTGAGGAATNFESVFKGYAGKVTPKIRENFLEGLRCAVLSYNGQNYTADIFSNILELAQSMNSIGLERGFLANPLFSATDMAHIRASVRSAPFRPGDERLLIMRMRALESRPAQ